jgi:hypothetical protein
LKVANLSEEMDLLADAREDALALLKISPRLDRPDLKFVRDELLRRFGETLELALVG